MTATVEANTFAAVVQAHLGAELEAMGFSWTGAAEDEPGRLTQVVFCADFDEVAARFPGLPVPQGYRVGAGLCFDVIVEGSLREGIADVRVEGCPVDDGVVGSGDLETDLRGLRTALARAFDDAVRG